MDADGRGGKRTPSPRQSARTNDVHGETFNGVINRIAGMVVIKSPLPSAGTPFRYSVRGSERESAGVTTAVAARYRGGPGR